jgi:hypothetical protein
MDAQLVKPDTLDTMTCKGAQTPVMARKGGAIARPQRRELNQLRPTRCQRNRYRQFVAALEAEVHRDPMHFDMGRVQLPPELQPDTRARDFLFDKLLKRLGALQSQLLGFAGPQ